MKHLLALGVLAGSLLIAHKLSEQGIPLWVLGACAGVACANLVRKEPEV